MKRTKKARDARENCGQGTETEGIERNCLWAAEWGVNLNVIRWKIMPDMRVVKLSSKIKPLCCFKWKLFIKFLTDLNGILVNFIDIYLLKPAFNWISSTFSFAILLHTVAINSALNHNPNYLTLFPFLGQQLHAKLSMELSLLFGSSNHINEHIWWGLNYGYCLCWKTRQRSSGRAILWVFLDLALVYLFLSFFLALLCLYYLAKFIYVI